MNAGQLANVVAAAFMAFEPAKPCELCVFNGGKCGDLATFEGFCNTGVALWYRQRTAPKQETQVPAKPVEEAQEPPVLMKPAKKPAALHPGENAAARAVRACVANDHARFFETVQSLRDINRREWDGVDKKALEARRRVVEQWPDIFGPGCASKKQLTGTESVRYGIIRAYLLDVAPELAAIWGKRYTTDYSRLIDAQLAAKLRAEAPKAGRVK